MNRTILTILLFLSVLCGTAQVREKVYLHTDKDCYLAGEIMWFKVYVTNAASNQPLALSKTVYVEIISKEQHPVMQARIGLGQGLGSGSFQLPFSIHSGNYILRAYTNWMKNDGPDYFYEKPLTILNTLRDPALIDSLLKTTAKAPSPEVQLFPEGGTFIAGLPNRIAFRIADQKGTPFSGHGALLGPDGDTLTRFQTLRFGMGQFQLIPKENTKYRVAIELEDHRQLTADLPIPEAKGYTLQLTEAGLLTITTRTNAPDNDSLQLIITPGPIKKIAPNSTATIEKTQLPDGISRITLLTASNKPLAERLYFKAPAPLNINIHTPQDQYSTREKITASIQTSLPVMLNGSMTVVLLDSLQSPEENDLLSQLYLTSELKGPIFSPGYYFSDNTPEVRQTADLLMMTQNARTISASTNLSSNTNPNPVTKTKTFPPEYAGLIVTGRVTDRKTGQPVAGVSAWLSAPGNYFHLAWSSSDKNGMIQWDLGALYGEQELVVEPANTEKNNPWRIDILSPFSETATTMIPSDLQLPHSAAQQLLWHSIGAQTQNAWQADKRRHFSQPPITDTTPFYGQPSKRFLLDDYTRFSSMEEVMREYAKETRIRNKNGDFSISLLSDQTNQMFFDAPPLILMDGVPIYDFNNVIRFDPLKLRKMEVVAKRYFLGDTLYNGIISYSSYQGDMAGFPLDSSAYIQAYEGLQAHRDFYSPLYETADQQKSRIADFRNILFWDPNWQTDSRGSGSVSFYSSDLPGRYAVIVEGITPDGKPGKGIATFTVQSIVKK